MTDSVLSDGLALDMDHISKRFDQTLVLDDVTFRVERGRIHGLVGHNGAGKSTLMKIALGGVSPSEGTVTVGRTRLTFSRPAEARDAGVGMVLQELSLIPTLSVTDNIFLNAEKTGAFGRIAAARERSEARELLHTLGIDSIDPDTEVSRLGIAEQQMVEIAKAVRLSKQLLILDEPTAPLSRHEVVRLFELVKRTAALGIGVVFITHHLREIFELCDSVTVLRGGRVVLSEPTSQTSLPELIAALVGSELAAVEAEASEALHEAREPLLVARDLSISNKLAGVSFELFPGEILGVAGLVGSGRTVLLKALLGDIPLAGGSVTLGGSPYRPSSPAGAVHRGVYMIPEDRRRHGVVLTHSVEQNMVMSILIRVSRSFVYSNQLARRTVARMVTTLGITAAGLQQAVGELSGGNQQKVVLAKALLADPRVFLLDEPTFGVDVRTAAEIIRRVRSEVEEGGRAAMWVSSDLTELVNVADRILILADGTVKSIIRRGSKGFTEDALLAAIQRSTGPATGPGALGPAAAA